MVCMLLSYALNSAIQKRKEYFDQMRTFQDLNSEERGSWADIFIINNKDVEDNLKECKCQCEPPKNDNTSLPKNMKGIIYDGCLDLIDRDDNCWDAKKIKATWKNLHSAAHFIFEELIHDFDRQEEEDLEADYGQYNDYGAIDMFSLKSKEEGDSIKKKDDSHHNRIFLLYSLVYCTLNPKQVKENFLENFESYEKYWVYLRDVSLADFVSIVPLLRAFFKVHDHQMSKNHAGYWRRIQSDIRNDSENLSETQTSDVRNDLENLADFFLERSFLEQAYDSGYNVYTAANVYYLAHETRGFIQEREKRKSERKSTYRDLSSAGSNAEKAQEKESTPLNENISTQKKELTIGQYIRQSFIVAVFLGYDESDAEATVKAQQVAEVQSSVERALICFILQASLYLGCLLLSTDKVCYEDTGLLGWIMKDFISCVVLFFSFQFLVSMAISEFYINSFCIFLDPTTKMFQKVALSLNFVVNSVLALTLIYSSALILKGSESFVDLILNSVAVFFVSELDDMLVSELDEEKLEERSVEALVGIMRRVSHKHQKGTTNRLNNEKWMIHAIGLFSLLFLLPCSVVMFFAGSADCS